MGKEAEISTRKTLSALYDRFGSLMLLIRILTITVIFAILTLVVFLLQKMNIIELTHQDIFSKNLIVPELTGAIGAIVTAIIIFAIADFNYNPNRFNYLTQVLVPNLLALILGSLIAIFLPWLVVFLILRKGNSYSSFKDWRKTFLQTSIGSVFYVSLPFLGFISYYIINNGPWPVWFMPNHTLYFAYMKIGILSCILYISILPVIFSLWLYERKEGNNSTSNDLT
ncbi:MAG: hypothetical protein HZR80_19555 [Candidatus Heimdallarchaeota archaeon]